MPALVSRDEIQVDGVPTGEVQIRWWCPGCRCLHCIRTSPPLDKPGWDTWQYNGDENAPTFSPSVLTTCPGHPVRSVCHIFVKAGEIQFLSDSTHYLSGRTVLMTPWADVLSGKVPRYAQD